MDDSLNDVLEDHEQEKLNEINGLHPKLKFTLEILKNNDENEDEIGRIAFLDMEIFRKGMEGLKVNVSLNQQILVS